MELEDKINYVPNACLFIYIFPCGFSATKRSIWGFLIFKILYIMYEMVCICFGIELFCCCFGMRVNSLLVH